MCGLFRKGNPPPKLLWGGTPHVEAGKNMALDLRSPEPSFMIHVMLCTVLSFFHLLALPAQT